MVTGVPTAAVQVAVTCVVGEAERWTEGSLTVQLELTSAAVFAAIHWGLPVEKLEAPKVALLAGGAAVWSTVADPGEILNDVVQLDEEVPPQAAIPNNAAQSRTDANIRHGNMVTRLSLCTTNVALQKRLYTEPQPGASVAQSPLRNRLMTLKERITSDSLHHLHVDRELGQCIRLVNINLMNKVPNREKISENINNLSCIPSFQGYDGHCNSGCWKQTQPLDVVQYFFAAIILPPLLLPSSLSQKASADK